MPGLGATLRNLLRKIEPAPGGCVPDRDLLERFCDQQDQSAFTELVQRHAALVLGVCRRVLPAADADDAFQATFLVLARKAAALDRRRSLGSWLYTVAFHIALKVKRGAACRSLHERKAAEMNAATIDPRKTTHEMTGLLDSELSSLPEKYRAPLVLCHLQGKTNEDAARELGWPAGSMSRRLARARELLRARLVRRGITLSAAGLATGLGEAAAVAVPPQLIEATAGLSLEFAAGTLPATGARVPAVTLARGALQGMFMTRLKLTVAALLCVAALASAAGWLGLPGDQPAPGPLPVVNATRVFEPAFLLDLNDPLRAAPVWGPTVNGLRVHVATDRNVYRLGKDLINVSFAIQNTIDKPFPITLGMTAEERTSVTLTGPGGVQRVIAGFHGPRLATKIWGEEIKPGKVARVNMLVDMAGRDEPGVERRKHEPLRPGRYQLKGTFSYEGPTQAAWLKPPFSLESNTVTFDVIDGDTAADLPGGVEQGNCRLSLLVERPSWKPGDGPIPFAVVLERRAEQPGGFRLLSIYGRTYYALEVVDPQGNKFVVPQPAPLPASVSPHFRFAQVAAGKCVGEQLAWDPQAAEVKRTTTLDDLIRASGPAAPRPGVYKIKAIYDVDARSEAKFSYGISADRLESNTVEVRTFDQTAPAVLPLEKQDQLWQQLGEADPLRARVALRTLAASGPPGLALIAARVLPAQPADAGQVRRLIANLDSDDFQVRERADLELQQLGAQAGPALAKALAAGPSLEAQRRLQRLLDRLNEKRVTPEELSCLRAVEALQQMNTDGARALLEKLAAGAAEARLTTHARAALGKLKERQ